MSVESTKDAQHDPGGDTVCHLEGQYLKFAKLVKVGLPLPAVKQRVVAAGLDFALLEKYLQEGSGNGAKDNGEKERGHRAPRDSKDGVGKDRNERDEKTKRESFASKTSTVQEKIQEQIRSEQQHVAAVAVALPTSQYFVITPSEKLGGAMEVTFSCKPYGQEKGVLIATLARKLTGARPRGNKIVVSMRDLYCRLGALREVRSARDAYNDTLIHTSEDRDGVGADDRCSHEEYIKFKRKPFLEHLSSVGTRPPDADAGERAHLPGLDDLIHAVEESHHDELMGFQRQIERDGMVEFNGLGELYTPGTRCLARGIFAQGVDMVS